MNKKYRLEFKKMACELLPKYNNSPKKVAVELAVPVKTYEKWVQAYRQNPFVFNEEPVSLEKEVLKLRKELKAKEETIELLKKTFAFSMEKMQ